MARKRRPASKGAVDRNAEETPIGEPAAAGPEAELAAASSANEAQIEELQLQRRRLVEQLEAVARAADLPSSEVLAPEASAVEVPAGEVPAAEVPVVDATAPVGDAPATSSGESGSEKQLVVAYALWALGWFGLCGLHRFYLGRTGTGLLWLFTFGMCGWGTLFDAVFMSRMVREANGEG